MNEDNHSPPHSTTVKNAWSYTTTLPYTLLASWFIKHRVRFTFQIYATSYFTSVLVNSYIRYLFTQLKIYWEQSFLHSCTNSMTKKSVKTFLYSFIQINNTVEEISIYHQGLFLSILRLMIGHGWRPQSESHLAGNLHDCPSASWHPDWRLGRQLPHMYMHTGMYCNAHSSSNRYITQHSKTSFNRIPNTSENKQSLSHAICFTFGMSIGIKFVVFNNIRRPVIC